MMRGGDMSCTNAVQTAAQALRSPPNFHAARAKKSERAKNVQRCLIAHRAPVLSAFRRHNPAANR
jgi:hypothetical protein